MRSDVKVGLAIGLVFLTALIIYMATRSGPSPDEQIAVRADDVEEAERPRRSIDDFLEDVSDPRPVRDPQPQVEPRVDEDPVPRPYIDPLEPTVEDDDPEEDPAPQPEPVQEEPAEEARSWTVRRGDSLWRIAEEVYGDGKHHQLIFEANRDKLRSPDALAEGMELTIPARSDKPEVEGNVERYTVKRGDTLWSLAERYYEDGNQWKRIAEANGMGEGDRLYEGRTILIPLD